MATNRRWTRRRARCAALTIGLLAGGPAAAAVSFVEPRALPLPVDGTASAGVYGLARGDLDGDGRLDVAATGAGLVPGGDASAERDFVAALLGNGDGTFQAPVILDLGPRDAVQPGGVAAADLDGDGSIDLVVVAQRTRQLLVLPGRGGGTFGTGAAIDTGADALTDVRLADLDGDGALDAVAVSMNADLSSRQLAILRGDGHGGLGSPVVRDVGRMPQGLALADLDGKDGPDILVACRVGSLGTPGTVEVLLNDGHGGFPGAPAAFAARTSPFGLWVADFDGDGKLDALVPGWEGALGDTCGTGCIALLRGDGLGGLASPTAEGVWRAEGYVLASTGDTSPLDLDLDGRPDAVFGHAGGANQVTTFLGAAGGGRATAGWVASPGSGLPVTSASSRVDGNHTLGIVAGDFDGDGAPDLVVASQRDARAGGLSFLRGVPASPGTFEAPRVLSGPRGGSWAILPRSLALRDFTGDAALDLLFFAGTLDTFPGLGTGLFGAPIDGLGVVGSEGYDTLRTGDLDGDGVLDAVFLGVDGVQGGNPPRHLLFLGNGDGTFGSGQALAPQTPGAAGRNAVLADLDGDGDLDLAVLTSEIGLASIVTRVETWLNGGGHPPAFTPGGVATVQPEGSMYSSGLAAGDLDGDGRADLVAHRLGPTDDLLLFRSNGDGTLAPPAVVTSELGQPVDTVLAGDLDGDGDTDLVALGAWGGAHVAAGRGDGTFVGRTAHDLAEGASDGLLVDLDGDGHRDVVSAAVNGLAVLPGKGDGGFGVRRPFATGVTASAALAAGDLDGDGRPDLVVGHGSAANRHFFTVLRNASGALADLAVSGARTPGALHAGQVLEVTFTVASAGPDAAQAVRLRSPLRPGMAPVSAAASQGTCAFAAGAATCDLGALAAGGSATAALRLRPAEPGIHWLTASVASATPEANGADDAAAVSVAVLAAEADLRAALTAAPEPVTAGGRLTYTATAVNDGPSLAPSAALALALPGGAALGTATTTRGTCSAAGGTVTCALGALDVGEAATVTVTVTPGSPGDLAAAAQVSSAVLDPHPADDRVELTTQAVAAPAPGKKGGCGCGSGGAEGLAGPGWLLVAAILRRRGRGGVRPA